MTGADGSSAVDSSTRAWDAWTRGDRSEAERLSVAATRALTFANRRERQLVEIVRLAITGHAARAHDLASEHLSEFPHDVLVVRVRTACAAGLEG